jgi:leucyl-tRNA synthetase
LYQARDAGPVDRDAWTEATRCLLLMMAPIAPHISEELWERTGGAYSIHLQAWPEADAELAREDEVTLVVQVNGKVRDRIQVPVEITEERAKELALGSEQVRRHLEGKQPRRVIYVPGKLVNVVA